MVGSSNSWASIEEYRYKVVEMREDIVCEVQERGSNLQHIMDWMRVETRHMDLCSDINGLPSFMRRFEMDPRGTVQISDVVAFECCTMPSYLGPMDSFILNTV